LPLDLAAHSPLISGGGGGDRTSGDPPPVIEPVSAIAGNGYF
jgi:hypothetical protein